jgi:phosphoribosyl-AMP cyclohydrolase
MSPSEFEFLINLIREKISKKNTTFRKAISFQERLTLTLRFDKFYDTFPSPLHFAITKTLKKPHNTTDSHHCSRQKHQEWKEGQRSGRLWLVMLQVQTCFRPSRYNPFDGTSKYRTHTEQAVTLPRNQFFIRYVVTSPVHTVTIRCYGTW